MLLDFLDSLNREFCGMKVSFRSRNKIILLTCIQNWSSPTFTGKLFLASCHLSLLMLLPPHTSPFFRHLMFLVPHCGIFSKPAGGIPILNPTKPLNFIFTMICKMQENSLIYRVKKVDSESQHIGLIAENSWNCTLQ